MKKQTWAGSLALLLTYLLVMLACDASGGEEPGPVITPAGQNVATPEGQTAEETYIYDDLPTPGEASQAIARFQAISQWSKLDLTYVFLNGTSALPGDQEQELVRAAFDLWAAETPLTFTEVDDPDEADIEVGWATGDHGDGDSFDGPGRILAHATFPNPYADRQVILHFDDDERWVNSDRQNVDLLTVAAHEIGHVLGLDHSNDPDALMYPAYQGPRRFLGDDDIAGAQSLYGIGSGQPNPQPEAPPPNAEPPSAGGQGDSDQDGLTDDEEIFYTGTDPNNPDSDNDRLADGTEVYYNMNPLDADMDRDGVSDGDEVEAGTDPFFPEQSVGSDVDDEVSEGIAEFLTEAIELEIEAFRQGDPNIAAQIMAGDVLANVEAAISELNNQGLVQINEIDYYESYISDIRAVNDFRYDVDTCETWTTTVYDLNSGDPVSSEGPMLLPQTITIEWLDDAWYITAVQFHDASAFCQ
jgi:hypothetical protein